MLPAFGDGALVRETVISILGQRDGRWRLAVIDDGVGTGEGDDLRSWLQDLGDERIRYLANPRRLGINRNFQRCADEAREDLVVVLGSDDRMLPHFVGTAIAVAQEFPDAAFVHAGAAIIGEDGSPVRPLVDRVKRIVAPSVRGRRVLGGEELAASLLRGNWMYFPSVVFRRSVLQRHGFRPGYDIVLDLDLYMRILLDGGAAVLLERPGLEYRRHVASLSSSGAGDGTRFTEELAYFSEVAPVMEDAGWPRAARAARMHWTSRLHAAVKVPGLLAAGNTRSARSMMHNAFARPEAAAHRRGARRP